MKSKIKYVAFVAASIDGRIARNNQSGTDWTSKEDWRFFQESLKNFDAVIVGHNTYKLAQKSLQKRNTVIFTSKIKKPKVSGSMIFMNPKHSDIALYFKENQYKRVAVLGGPQVYNFCLVNKMLDELFLTIEPYIFTSGVPMFLGLKFRKHSFILKSVKKLNKRGTILLKYAHAD